MLLHLLLLEFERALRGSHGVVVAPGLRPGLQGLVLQPLHLVSLVHLQPVGVLLVVHGLGEALVDEVAVSRAHDPKLAHLQRKQHVGALDRGDHLVIVRDQLLRVSDEQLQPGVANPGLGELLVPQLLLPRVVGLHEDGPHHVPLGEPEVLVPALRDVVEVPEAESEEDDHVAHDVVEVGDDGRLQPREVLGPGHELHREDGAGAGGGQAVAACVDHVLLRRPPVREAAKRRPAPDALVAEADAGDVLPPRYAVGHGVVVAPAPVPHRLGFEAERQLHEARGVCRPRADVQGLAAGAKLHAVRLRDIGLGVHKAAGRIQVRVRGPGDDHHHDALQEELLGFEAGRARVPHPRRPPRRFAGPVRAVARLTQGVDGQPRVGPPVDGLVIWRQVDAVVRDLVRAEDLHRDRQLALGP
mmetsp:Transcript_36629/g.96962  ORF Transcript_36629/g.96962 Transcript_36629/m.96962 type:complete len:414 (-) Transcript_36629:1535-2776(-)